MKIYTHFVFAVVLILIAVSTSTFAQEERAISLRVEKGDTLLNLFGSDWQKAFRQNPITVVRNGKTNTSPDILVEGEVLTINRSTLLTARAAARVDDLKQKRAELEQRLSALETRTAERPDLSTSIAFCRSKLEASQFYVADVDFVNNEIAELESATIEKPTPEPPARLVVAISGAIMALVLLVGGWLGFKKPQSSVGLVRYKSAEAEIKALLGSGHSDSMLSN